MKDLPPVSWGKGNLSQIEDICMYKIYICISGFFFLLACVGPFIFAWLIIQYRVSLKLT